MPEFLELLPPQKALEILLQNISHRVPSEEISTSESLGRITAESVYANHPLPSFSRSTVDGYALRASDTYGANDSLPAYLKVIGEISMGAEAKLSLQTAQCAVIHTGGMLPENANAVIMLEHTQYSKPNEIEVMRSIGVGENVIQVGEDVKPGDLVIPTGTCLRPAEIGGLMALGQTRLRVVLQPKVGILSSGDEVIPPEQILSPGKVRDVNAYTLSSLVQSAGGIPLIYGIIPDREEDLQNAAASALKECDLVVITAGSSASARDLTAKAINRLGKPGVLVHGIDIRPGKPTILAVSDSKPVIGLPGNPVSALVIAWLFVVPVIEHLMGLSGKKIRARVTARITINVPSQAGREDWIPVQLLEIGDENAKLYHADPVFGKSNLIFTLARADGLVRIPPDVTGLSSGELVDVYLF